MVASPRIQVISAFGGRGPLGVRRLLRMTHLWHEQSLSGDTKLRVRLVMQGPSLWSGSILPDTEKAC